jgi:hypothetical protein
LPSGTRHHHFFIPIISPSDQLDMLSQLFSAASATAVLVLLPAVQAHMAMWHPSAYGFNNGWEPATPLANKPFDQWVSRRDGTNVMALYLVY